MSIFLLTSWANALTEENLNQCLFTNYNHQLPTTLKNIGLILAGNIPLVGFHDLVCVLISGNNARIKTSSNDQHLIQLLAAYLIHLDNRFEKK